MATDDTNGITIVPVGDIGNTDGASEPSASGDFIPIGGSGGINAFIGSGNTRSRRTRRNSSRTGSGGNSGGSEEESATVPVRRTKTQVKQESITLLVALLFGALEMWRGSHWAKKAEDIDPLTEAICDYLNTLPAKKKAAINHTISPLTIALAAIFLLAEPLKVEMELARNGKKSIGVTPQGTSTAIREEVSNTVRSNGNSQRFEFPDIPYADAGINEAT